MPLYQGWKATRKDGNVTGSTRLHTLDYILPPTRPTDKPLRLRLQSAYKNWRNWYSPCAPSGDWCSQTRRGGHFAPVNSTPDTKSVKMHHEALSEDLPRDDIKNVSVKDVCCGKAAGDSTNSSTLMEAIGLKAQVIILNHPAQTSAECAPVLQVHQLPLLANLLS